jgi:isochorismate hydrolase
VQSTPSRSNLAAARGLNRAHHVIRELKEDNYRPPGATMIVLDQAGNTRRRAVRSFFHRPAVSDSAVTKVRRLRPPLYRISTSGLVIRQLGSVYDAFFETDLDSILRNNRIKTIIIVGTATNVCSESTARSGFFRDYQVAFPSDCNASFDEGMHQAPLKTIDMFFGRVMTSEELLEEMRNELGRNDRVTAE